MDGPYLGIDDDQLWETDTIIKRFSEKIEKTSFYYVKISAKTKSNKIPSFVCHVYRVNMIKFVSANAPLKKNALTRVRGIKILIDKYSFFHLRLKLAQHQSVALFTREKISTYKRGVKTKTNQIL